MRAAALPQVLPRRLSRRRGAGGLLAAALALLATLFLFALPARAAFTPPPLEGHVVDTAGKLTPSDVRYLDAKLDQLRRRTGFEMVAFIVGSLEGETIDDVAYKAFNTWQIGRERQDNGVLLVIAPAERRVRIETGKGVGGALTDLQSNDIIRQRINPLLQQDRFRDAIDQGSTAIAEALVAGTPGSEERKASRPQAQPPSPLAVGALAGLLVLTILLAIVSPGFRSFLFLLLQFVFFFGGRGGGGGGGGSGYSGGGGRSGGGGSSDDY